MGEPRAFIVQPEWRGNRYFLHNHWCGDAVARISCIADMPKGEEWTAFVYVGNGSPTHHSSESEARAAVEAAVMKLFDRGTP